MKILAVIPARAGSKGIPNKNIRIIGGHPLIYYSIKNALDSKYITDVIISTDSPEVRIIATQMGTKYKWRDKSLCGDDVTLDSVVYDAVPKDEQWDYVVTMQPTSPTLKVDTLDAAIKYTIDNDLETCISAVNAPHLSWRDENGRKVPNYEKRLNRQYLPANYLETGAFFISKASIVTPESRFGQKVGVFEILRSAVELRDVPSYEPISKFPSVRRDFAFVIDKSVAVADLVALIREVGGKVVTDVKIFDVFEDESLGDKRSVAVGVIAQDVEHTLEESEVEALAKAVVDAASAKLGAVLRS